MSQDLAGAEAGPRWGAILSLAVLAVLVAVTVLPSLPWAPLVLGPLLALAWFSLRRLLRDDPPSGRTAVAAEWPVGVPPRRLGPLVLVPVTAVALYAALVPLDAGVRGEGPFFALLLGLVLLMTLVGSVALLWSLWRTWRPRRLTSPSELSKNPSVSAQLPV